MSETRGQPKTRVRQRVLILGGCMRSGTTIIHRALCTAKNSNPYLSESWFIRDLFRLYRAGLSRYQLRYADQFGAVRNFEQLMRINLQFYTSMVSARYGDPDVLIFKHPELIRYFVELGQLFPAMLFLAIVRDPRDVITSMKQIRDKQIEGGMVSPVAPLGTIEALCRFYAGEYQRVLRHGARLGQRLMFVRYEDVMQTPEEVVARIGEFCGAEYDFDEIRAYQKERTQGHNLDKEFRLGDEVSGTFWSDLYTKDLSSERIGRFAKVLTSEEVEEIQNRLAPIGSRFRYW